MVIEQTAQRLRVQSSGIHRRNLPASSRSGEANLVPLTRSIAASSFVSPSDITIKVEARDSLNVEGSMRDTSKIFEHAIEEHIRVIQALHSQRPVLERVAAEMCRTILNGRKILWCGNGGSAADSQHLAAELVGRFLVERRALPSIALTTDTSILTAIGNDFGYEHVFRRQVEALGVSGDLIVGLSTSGNSRNVVNALTAARELGLFTVAFTGQGGGAMANLADEVLCVPSTATPRIQEGHILCGHMLCDCVEKFVCQEQLADTEKVAR
jgi:D-sedoheptulose 7-phosphate isomerase